jgi:hypothetical protein
MAAVRSTRTSTGDRTERRPSNTAVIGVVKRGEADVKTLLAKGSDFPGGFEYPLGNGIADVVGFNMYISKSQFKQLQPVFDKIKARADSQIKGLEDMTFTYGDLYSDFKLRLEGRNVSVGAMVVIKHLKGDDTKLKAHELRERVKLAFDGAFGKIDREEVVQTHSQDELSRYDKYLEG